MTVRERLHKILLHDPTQLGEFEALFELRNLLDDVQALEIYIAADLLLHDNERSLLECDKDHMRKQDYDFYEDLESARELLTRGGEDREFLGGHDPDYG